MIKICATCHVKWECSGISPHTDRKCRELNNNCMCIDCWCDSAVSQTHLDDSDIRFIKHCISNCFLNEKIPDDKLKLFISIIL